MSKKEMTLGELCRAIINETSEGILDLINSIGKEIGVSLRQISKSRKRGWIWTKHSVVNPKRDFRLKYTAPPAVHLP